MDAASHANGLPPKAVTAYSDDLEVPLASLDRWLTAEGFAVQSATLDGLVPTSIAASPQVVVAVLPRDRDLRVRVLLSFAEIRKARPRAGILLIFQDAELPVYQAAPVVASGVGFILQASAIDREYLVSAVRHVAAGGVVVDPEIMARPTAVVKDLSPRQIEVLELMASGLDNSAIAQKLHLSDRTIEGRIRDLYHSLGLFTRGENRRVVAVLTYLRAVGTR